MHQRIAKLYRVVGSWVIVLATATNAAAMSITEKIAKPGDAVTGHPLHSIFNQGTQRATFPIPWAEEILHLLNDPLRTNGWHTFFSGMPNDSVEFEFEVYNMEQANHLLELFSRIDDRPVRIVLDRSPRLFTNSGQGQGTAAIEFVMGDQNLIDFWFNQLPTDAAGNKVSGKWVLTKPFPAAPPTLIIHVQHPAIDVTKLSIPSDIEVVDHRLSLNAKSAH